MDWRTSVEKPTREPSGRSRLRDGCPGLMRFFGLAGFLTAGLSALRVGASWLGYEPEWWFDATWDIKTVALVGGAFLAGGIGGLLGASIGLSIPVPNERVNHALTVVWHYLANGSIAFGFLVVLVMGRTVGDNEEIEAFVREIGSETFTLYLAVFSAAASVLAAVLVLVFGLFPRGGKTRLPAAFFVAVPPSLLASYLLFAQFGWNSRLWLLIGVLHPIAMVLVSAHLVLRDAIAREQSRKGMI
ncbi:MAG: hypothetical protein JSV80_16780 [Acidobacteriota bacterium]|nr:MAG: hypothetical protein JSV80_16780 [Acidobacteriota bacterium]